MYSFPANLFCDVRIEQVYRSILRIEMGKLEEIKEKNDTGAFIRIFDGKRWFYSSTTDIENIQNEIDSLATLADADGMVAQHPLIKKLQANQGTYNNFSGNEVESVSLGDKRKLLDSYLNLIENDSEITHWSGIYTDNHSQKQIYSSLGANLKFDTQIAGLRVGVRFGSGKNVFSESWCKAKSSFKELETLHDEAKNFIEQARDFFHNAEKIEGGNYTVVLSPMAAGIFAHESFGHKSEADFMVGDETMIKEWKLGKKVGSDILNIVDSGIVAGSGFCPYDDEGTKAGKTMLIENGKLQGRLHSAMTAAELQEETTGNARSVSFEYEPIVRMTCTYIEPGQKTKDQIFAEIENGIFIDSVKHGSGMSTFTLAPSMAYLIKNGKIDKPVKFSVITGNVMKTLDKIDAVSDSLEILSFVGGGCGKMEQYPLPVSFGGPYVRVSEINVQ
ncbi:MAG: TldD protein [Clostridiales bacterium]|nr:TldD protein [Clostridiales bacterium]MDN5281016.1 TldD protein [Candidatus Ozemobacter sp.]